MFDEDYYVTGNTLNYINEKLLNDGWKSLGDINTSKYCSPISPTSCDYKSFIQTKYLATGRYFFTDTVTNNIISVKKSR